jgi:hypothetical protein
MTGGIQTTVGGRQAPAKPGDWASNNPGHSYVAGPGGLVAGSSGVTVANFAWVSFQGIDYDDAPTIVNSFGAGTPAGFVHNQQQALITTYLADSTLIIPQGFGVTLMTDGDFWVSNSGSSYVTPGMQAFATLSSGAVTFAAPGTSVATASGSSSSIAPSTSSVTGSVVGNILTVTVVGSGTLYPGTTISGTNVTTGSMIMSQLSGTTGGVGTYALNIGDMAVAAGTTISGTYGTLTVGGTVVSGFQVGSLLAGTNVVAGTYITALISGSGGAGTYVANNNTSVGSTSITGTTAVATGWYAWSGGSAGAMIKMGSVGAVNA